MARIAINGLGRIGKLVLRDLIDNGAGGDIVLINDPKTTVEQLSLLMEFDSVHGRWGKSISWKDETLVLDGQKIKVSHKKIIQAINLKENNIELDNTISEEVTLDDGKLPKGIYKLANDITFDKEDADSPDALEGDEVQVFEPVAPTDTVLGVEIFPVIHIPTQTKIFVSAEDITEVGIEDLEL